MRIVIERPELTAIDFNEIRDIFKEKYSWSIAVVTDYDNINM